MLTLLVWDGWCEVVGEALYDFMASLFDVDRDAFHAFNVGFDEMERITRPEFFLE